MKNRAMTLKHMRFHLDLLEEEERAKKAAEKTETSVAERKDTSPQG